MVISKGEPGVESAGNIPTDVLPATSSNDYEGTVTDNQPSTMNDFQLISTFLDVKAFCHINLVDANISIAHDDHSRLVFTSITGFLRIPRSPTLVTSTRKE